MARRYATRGRTSRAPARRSSSRAAYRAAPRRTGRTPVRRAATPQVVRIVFEQSAAGPAVPAIGVKEAPKVKKAKF